MTSKVGEDVTPALDDGKRKKRKKKKGKGKLDACVVFLKKRS